MSKTSKPRKSLNLVSTLSISVVLFILGIVFYTVLNSNRLVSSIKENVKVFVYLKKNLYGKDLKALKKNFEKSPYVNRYKYFNKSDAFKVWRDKGGEDFSILLDANVLPAYFEVNIKSVYVNPNDIESFKNDFEQYPYVADVLYPKMLVSKFSFLNKVIYVLIAVAFFLFIVSIILIDGAIRMYFFTNRFLIRTMLLVGATSSYIASPYVKRAIFNGFISGLIASGCIYFAIDLLHKNLPELQSISNDIELFGLFGILFILGVLISFISTYRSIIKYLKKPIDQLY